MPPLVSGFVGGAAGGEDPGDEVGVEEPPDDDGPLELPEGPEDVLLLGVGSGGGVVWSGVGGGLEVCVDAFAALNWLACDMRRSTMIGK